ncbi:adenine phosphoribosyltransferase [Brevibacterium litoralis]|uniref:adenine phosphoribosyltransferase n=1 Tax=Brevibacterium litoralis TaxID=3138935 RepID=UPI003D9A5F99
MNTSAPTPDPTAADPSTPAPTDLTRAADLITAVPDHPEPGIVFRDISPLLADGPALRAVVRELLAPFSGAFDLVAGLEARGFLLAGYAAALTGVGMLQIRKAGKLPAPGARVSYDLEYGSATIEGPDVLEPGARVLLLDDVLATGGTLAAARTLVTDLGGTVAGAAVILDLPALDGRAVCGEVHSLFSF